MVTHIGVVCAEMVTDTPLKVRSPVGFSVSPIYSCSSLPVVVGHHLWTTPNITNLNKQREKKSNDLSQKIRPPRTPTLPQKGSPHPTPHQPNRNAPLWTPPGPEGPAGQGTAIPQSWAANPTGNSGMNGEGLHLQASPEFSHEPCCLHCCSRFSFSAIGFRRRSLFEHRLRRLHRLAELPGTCTRHYQSP